MYTRRYKSKTKKRSRSRRSQRGGSGSGNVGDTCNWHPITGRDTCLPGIKCSRKVKQCENRTPPVLALEQGFFDTIDPLRDEEKNWEKIKKLVDTHKQYFNIPLYAGKRTFLMNYIQQYTAQLYVFIKDDSFFGDEASKQMLEYSDVDATDIFENTALMYLIINCLRDSGYNIKYSPRHPNTFKDYTKILDMFLDKTTDINKKNKEGNTALHLLFLEGFFLIESTKIYLEAILKKGADITLKNNDNKTPLELATIGVKDMEKRKKLNETETTIWNEIKQLISPPAPNAAASNAAVAPNAAASNAAVAPNARVSNVASNARVSNVASNARVSNVVSNARVSNAPASNAASNNDGFHE
jgi:hypothetical protein